VLTCIIDLINSYFVISYSRAKIYFMAVSVRNTQSNFSEQDEMVAS